MILKQGHKYRAMPHDGKVIRRIYRGGRCYYIASPYSPEATQALKAAFPQYWTAIRDYGWANPQLVPFINEDPMLIVSLVEVGKTRWLDNGGTAFINLGESVLQYPFGVKAMLKYNALGGERDYCGNEGTTRRYPLEMGVQNGKNFGMWSNPSGWWTPTQVAVDMVLEFDARFDETSRYLSISKDGAEKEEFTKSYNNNIIQANQNVALFAGGVDGYCVSDLCTAYYEVTINGKTLHLLPFTRNGENGMLDIVSLTFHPNANTQGAFTIQITDKA